MTPVTDSLAGRLLVSTHAHGGEEDVFAASVVLVLMHDEDGTHGVVLNHPLEVPVDRVLDGWQAHVTEPGWLFQGGPVGLDTAMGLIGMPGEKRTEQLGARLLFGSVGVVDLDAPPELLVPELSGLRIFAGYSGWEAGQVERELAAGEWLVADLEPRDPFTRTPENLWAQVVRRQAVEHTFLLTRPVDAALN